MKNTEKLLAERITAYNKSEKLGREIHIFEEIPSTNTYAKELAAKGAAHGTIVIAESQTGGKGRLGRKFESPSGAGIYMSVIIFNHTIQILLIFFTILFNFFNQIFIRC